MLYIDMDRLSPSDAWLAKAEEALELVSAAETRADRSEAFRLKAIVWSLIKRDLSNLSNGKCWYCEVRQTRSIMAVDHFRPKGKLKDVIPEHDGYWWLAFEISNYRFSCTRCNSPLRGEDDIVRGKHNSFPLLDETKRARKPADDLSLEEPILLDPARATDPPLLFFDSDGRVHPNPRLCPEGTARYKRVCESIELYDLNQPGLRDRRKRLNRRLNRELATAMRYWPGFLKESQPDSALFEESCTALKQYIADFAALAATARSYLRGKRTEDGVVEQVLNTVE